MSATNGRRTPTAKRRVDQADLPKDGRRSCIGRDTAASSVGNERADPDADPIAHVRRGERAAILGGDAEAPLRLAERVGARGRVLVICPHLGAFRASQSQTLNQAARIEARRARIPDLAGDPALIERWLAEHPVRDAASLEAFEEFSRRQRRERPLLADASIDGFIVAHVLNGLDAAARRALAGEILRVLAPGGRALFCDVVADENIPEAVGASPDLWGASIAGGLREDEYLAELAAAGFDGLEILSWPESPWRTVEGVEFRALTVAAYRGEKGPCIDYHDAVIYRGPFRAVEDDDGHRYPRGERIAVCRKTFERLRRSPYARHVIFLEPRTPVAEPTVFDCSRPARRDPRETKASDRPPSSAAAGACCSSEDCC